MSSEPGYILRLCNGAEWRICSSESMAGWVEEYAGIMGLEKAEGLSEPFCFFYDGRTEDTIPESIRKITRNYKWRKIKYHKSEYYTSAETESILYAILNETTEEDRIYNMWFSLHPFYYHFIRRRIFPMHAGLAERNGKGILIAAPGGTGKSTCCRRLPKDWRVLSDDEVIIVLKLDNSPGAHPLPTWSNLIVGNARKSWASNDSVKVDAIFFIEPADIDEIIPLNQADSAALINQSATQIMRRAWDYWNSGVKRKMQGDVFAMACIMAASAKGYKLRVSLESKFWEEIDKVLSVT